MCGFCKLMGIPDGFFSSMLLKVNRPQVLQKQKLKTKKCNKNIKKKMYNKINQCDTIFVLLALFDSNWEKGREITL